MKIWKILSPKVLTAEERPDAVSGETQAKVKVTKLLLSDADMRNYSGTLHPKYPLVPGMFAVGVVGEAGAGCTAVEKNTRVYLHDTLPCGSCEHCLAGDTESCAHPRTAGMNGEGFLRDFVVTEESMLSPLPPSVSDEEALFVGVVSACEAVVDKLDAPKGTHVAVFGAGTFGNILSQLLIYRQAVPVLIDGSEEKLAVAAQCGVYYTLKTDETLKDELMRITGGRMAAASVYCSFCGVPPETAFEMTAGGGRTVFAGFAFPDMQAKLNIAQEKRLTLCSVTNGLTNYGTAINLLVNKAIDIAPFRIRTYPASEAEKALAESAESLEKGINEGPAVINMLA